MTVTMATFMEVLDTSIANVSLPHIAGSLGATYDEAIWVLTSYLVSAAIVLPASGWLSTVFGRKRFYMTCVVLFTVSSFLCGIAPNLPFLIIARILQGAGGGGLQPSEQAILADTFPPEKRGQAFAVYGMAVVAAPAIGPTLGGWITDNFNWHWIFFINLPVGLLSLYFTSRLVEDPPWLREKKFSGIKIDYIGLSLLVIGIACFQFVLDKGQESDWFASPMITALDLRRPSDARRIFPLGVVSPQSHRGRAPAQEPQLRNSRRVFVRLGNGLVRLHGLDPGTCAQIFAGGELLLSWGAPGTDPGEFNIAHNITCDADGWVYVADRENHRVQVFDGNGRYETQWNNLHRPCGLYMPPGKCPVCYIGELGSVASVNRNLPNLGPRVTIVDNTGRKIARLGGIGPGMGPTEFLAPHGLAVDLRGDCTWARCRGPTGRRPGRISPCQTTCGRCTSFGRCTDRQLR